MAAALMESAEARPQMRDLDGLQGAASFGGASCHAAHSFLRHALAWSDRAGRQARAVGLGK
jgi:hypothetical protein